MQRGDSIFSKGELKLRPRLPSTVPILLPFLLFLWISCPCSSLISIPFGPLMDIAQQFFLPSASSVSPSANNLIGTQTWYNFSHVKKIYWLLTPAASSPFLFSHLCHRKMSLKCCPYSLSLLLPLCCDPPYQTFCCFCQGNQWPPHAEFWCPFSVFIFCGLSAVFDMIIPFSWKPSVLLASGHYTLLSFFLHWAFPSLWGSVLVCLFQVCPPLTDLIQSQG